MDVRVRDDDANRSATLTAQAAAHFDKATQAGRIDEPDPEHIDDELVAVRDVPKERRQSIA